MKHKIDVPEGCRVVSVETTDEMVVVKFEKEEPNMLEQEPNIREQGLGFNENEILFCKNSETKWVAIFDKCKDNLSFYAKCIYVIGTEDLAINEWSFYGPMIRLATESEKQLLFDKLKEKCLMFDGENVVRWRAANDESYYCSLYYNQVNRHKEGFDRIDDDLYETGNYFPTRELAEAFQKQYLELLINFHKNLEQCRDQNSQY